MYAGGTLAPYQCSTSGTADQEPCGVANGTGGEGVTTKSVTGDSHDAFPLKMSQTAAKEKAWVRAF